MSPATPAYDSDDAYLARAAARDDAAAQKVHERLMAADDTAEIAELVRSQQRLTRSLRQTLLLKAKLAREQQAAEAEAAGLARWGGIMGGAPPVPRPGAQAHISKVRAAVTPVIRGTLDVERAEFFESELDDLLRDLSQEPDFLDAPVEALAAHVCGLFGLPPRPEWPPDPNPPLPERASEPGGAPPPDSS